MIKYSNMLVLLFKRFADESLPQSYQEHYSALSVMLQTRQYLKDYDRILVSKN